VTAGVPAAAGTDPWEAAERWAGALKWASIGSQELPLAAVTFESGDGQEASLLITPGRIAVIGAITGMTPQQGRQFVGLVCRGIALAEHPLAATDNPGDNPGDNRA
jgi:hypothetical protein